jgi:hypothetical protein
MTRVRVTSGCCLLPAALVLAVTVSAQAQTASSSSAPVANTAAVSTRSAKPLVTRPEASQFRETSRYDDVIAFMKQAAALSPKIHLTTYGYTFEGRPLPLAVIGAPAATADAVKATKKIRIYIQGNIHAGEVEGKEALLWLLRSVAAGERDAWLKSVVLLINPIYNADGNEKVNLMNRGSQWGPIGGMGQRYNGQNLDLNRDCTKLETSEGRSLAALMTDYDPHVAMDLHTTDGSAHGFYLTYQTSVSPNTSPGIMSFLRKDLLPAVTKTIKAKHGWDYFWYGNFSRGERAWYNDLDLYKPRYTQTYFGLRNRLGILVETYSYASFEDRIKSNYWFIEEVIDYVIAHGDQVRKVTAEADAESIVGKPQMVRGKLVKAAEPVQVVLADVADERHPYVPDRPMRRRVNGTERTETMPHYDLIEPTETSLAPRAYVLPLPPPGAPAAAPAPPAGPPPGMVPGRVPAGPPPGGFGRGPSTPWASVIDRLTAHGITFTKTTTERVVKGERFRITANKAEEQDYQNHKLRTIEGSWEPAEVTVPAGSLVIPMDQPLARLVFVLLDPRSDDGFTTWNLLDRDALGKNPAPEFHPVIRTMDPVR